MLGARRGADKRGRGVAGPTSRSSRRAGPNPEGRVSVRVLPGVFTSGWTVRVTSSAPGTRQRETRRVRAWSLRSALRVADRIDNELRRTWAEEAAAAEKKRSRRRRRPFR